MMPHWPIMKKAIQVDGSFAPAYLGRARVLELLDPGVDPSADLSRALEADPKFSEAYLERANYFITIHDYESALQDLLAAEHGMPASPLLHLYMAQVYLSFGQYEKGLEHQLAIPDRTLLQVISCSWPLLNDKKKYNPSDIYTQFEKNDAEWLSGKGESAELPFQ
jgi:tetratricopeptide (TPR) repeat protein